MIDTVIHLLVILVMPPLLRGVIIKTKALVDPKPGQRWLLVTSAWHMPRAMAAFRKAGFQVEPWPVDYRTAGWSDAFHLFPFESPAQGLRQLDLAVHEWLGLLAYRLSGRSDDAFPHR